MIKEISDIKKETYKSFLKMGYAQSKIKYTKEINIIDFFENPILNGPSFIEFFHGNSKEIINEIIWI